MGLTPEDLGLKPEETEIGGSPEKTKADLAKTMADLGNNGRETLDLLKDPQLEEKVGKMSKDKREKILGAMHLLASVMMGTGAALLAIHRGGPWAEASPMIGMTATILAGNLGMFLRHAAEGFPKGESQE